MLQRIFVEPTLEPRRPMRPERSTSAVTVVRIGIVCPYSFDVPGGVQYHVSDLAEDLHRRRATT